MKCKTCGEREAEHCDTCLAEVAKMCGQDDPILRRVIKRLGLRFEPWGEGEWIAVSEKGVIGGTLTHEEVSVVTGEE